ncbi:MAG: SDR family NAD(P)-dependent oxidoreductase [Solirubrobacteraceae bacterium]
MRAALVSGGSSGIGLAIARALAEEGYALTLAARREDALQRARRSLPDAGALVEVVAVDLATEEGVRSAVAAHRDAHGRLDVLVNNVGTGVGQHLRQITARRLDLQLALNLRTAVLMYRECAALLRAAGAEHRSAWIVNTASRSARIPLPWLSVYSASKAGLVAFSHAMDEELAEEGVRSCAICPGTVRTDLTSYLDGEAGMLESRDIAEVVRMLLRLSPACRVGEVALEGPADRRWRPPPASTEPRA